MMQPRAEDSPPDQISLRDVWAVLRRQRWMILGCMLLAVVLGGAFALSRPSAYEASALIRVDEKRSSLSPLEALDARPTGNQVATEMEVLRSRGLAAAVVDSLQLRLAVTGPRSANRDEIFSLVRVAPEADSARYRLILDSTRVIVEDANTNARKGIFALGEHIQLGGTSFVLKPSAARHPEIEVEVLSRARAVDELVEALKIKQPNPDASVIRVQFSAANPELARDVPNVLTNRFLALRRGVQQTESGSTAEFLRQQLDTVSTQLTAAENQLQTFREQAQVIDPQVEGRAQVERLAELQAERGALEAERSSLAQLLREVEASGPQRPGAASPYRRLLAFPSLLRNQSTSELLRSLSSLENERAALLTRRDPSDPDVQILSSRISELEDQLQATVRTYLQALTSQVASIDATLAQFQRQLNMIPANEVQLSRLSRRSKALEEIHGSLQTRLKEVEIVQAAEDPSVRVVDYATLPSAPANSNRKIIVGFSAVVGLLIGIGVAFVREYTDASVRTRGDLQAATGIPLLGLIPKMDNSVKLLGPETRQLSSSPTRLNGSDGRNKKRKGRTFLPAVSSSPTPSPSLALARISGPTPLSDAYDRLHTNILFSGTGTEPKTVLFTSALPADGKTTTATNLAIVLAQRGLKILLIDADLRRGSVHTMLQADRDPGLAEFLAGKCALRRVLRRKDVGNGQTLSYITTGSMPSHPAQLLGSARMAALIQESKELYDRIIVDSPPLNIVADSAVLAPNMDGVVIVARAGITPFEALAYAAEQFRSTNMPVIGAVLNDVDFKRDASYDAAYASYAYGASYYRED